MGGNCGMEKSDAETCNRNRGENGLIHENEKKLSRLRMETAIPARNGEDLSG
jgi:hypothetical protein